MFCSNEDLNSHLKKYKVSCKRQDEELLEVPLVLAKKAAEFRKLNKIKCEYSPAKLSRLLLDNNFKIPHEAPPQKGLEFVIEYANELHVELDNMINGNERMASMTSMLGHMTKVKRCNLVTSVVDYCNTKNSL